MKHKLSFTQEELDLLLMGLRYLEINHMGEDVDAKRTPETRMVYRAEFKKLLNEVYSQVSQTTLFKE